MQQRGKRSQLQIHQTFLTIQICSYSAVLNDESHLIINWRRLANCLLLSQETASKHYIKASVVPCANILPHAHMERSI